MSENENCNTSIWKIIAFVIIGVIVGYLVGRFELNTVDFKIKDNNVKIEDHQENKDDDSGEEKADEQIEINIENKPFLGNEEAAVILVVFGDYESPFSNKFHRDFHEDLTKDYIDSGKIKYIYKNFPLDLHKNAFQASMATYCSNDQGKYWEMHNLLITKHEELINADDVNSFLNELAKEIFLGDIAFSDCLNNHTHKSEVNKDIEEAKLLNIKNTPTIFINNHLIKEIPQDYSGLQDHLENYLN